MSEETFDPKWLALETVSEWEVILFEFAKRHGRPVSELEEKWLRMRYECSRLAEPQREYAMAAAKEGFNERIADAASGTQVFEFVSEGEAYRVTVEVTALPGEDPEVTVNMRDRNGEDVPHGRILFPGTDVMIETDDDGWQVIPYSDYERCIRAVMRIQCSAPQGAPMDMTML